MRNRSKPALIAIGLVALFFGGQLTLNLVGHLRSAAWTRTPAAVVEIKQHTKSAELNYAYTFDGQDFLGSRYQYMSPGTVPEKREILDRFKEGDTISVLVNPAKPSQAVAHRAALQLQHFGTYILLFSFSGVIGLCYFVSNANHRTRRSTTTA